MAEPHDYVIVGTGSAGCVLANRLTARGARVLLIEAGGSDRKLPVKAPVAFPELFQGPNDWNFGSEPEPMNTMLYVRGNRTDYNSLTSEGEVAAFLRAIELIREIASRPPLSELLVEELNPGASLHGADDLTAWLRATAEHEYHPSCTCRIGSPETGVVDAELRVHGVEGLRVADASVMPRVTSGNTHAPTVMIGERCADLVIGEPNSSE